MGLLCLCTSKIFIFHLPLHYVIKDTVALQTLYFLKINIFISLHSCQFVEYLFKIKIYIFQFLKTKKGDNVSFVYFYK